MLKSRLLHPSSLYVWGFRLLALGAFFFSLYRIVLRQFWIGFLGGTSPFTLGSVAILYLLSEYTLSGEGVEQTDAMILSILFAYAFVETFELIYHFSFPIYIARAGGEEIRFLILHGTVILPVFLLRKHFSYDRLSKVLLSLFIFIWVVWILYGFPQYFVDGYYYPKVFKTEDPFTLSLVLNFTSKTVLAAFFASLLKPKQALEQIINYRWYSRARTIVKNT